MKLKNKKTGQVGNFIINKDHFECVDLEYVPEYRNLAELNAEWEDIEEPKEYYAIDLQGDIIRWARHSWDERTTNKIKEIGNYFETEEEAEKTVEKLKAWKRLKDKGFEFINFPYKKICKYDARTGVGNLEYQVKYYEELEPDLDLLFGGEE